MPLKNFTTGNIPYLEKYTPHKLLSPQVVEVVRVQDMIRYSVLPNSVPTRIDYKLGTANSYIARLNVTNITDNANLELRIIYSKEIFHLNFPSTPLTQDLENNLREVVKLLKPGETLNIDILTNNSMLDLMQLREGPSNIQFTVKNLFTNEIVTTQRVLQNYTPEYFPAQVRVE